MYRQVLSFSLVAIFAVGCFNHAYVNPKVTAQAEPAYSHWHSHWLFGLISTTAEVELDEVCPQGVARVEDYQTFVNGLIGVLIGIVYHPTTVRVYCAQGSAKTIEIPGIDEAKLHALAEQVPGFEARLAELRDTTNFEAALATDPLALR